MRGQRAHVYYTLVHIRMNSDFYRKPLEDDTSNDKFIDSIFPQFLVIFSFSTLLFC